MKRVLADHNGSIIIPVEVVASEAMYIDPELRHLSDLSPHSHCESFIASVSASWRLSVNSELKNELSGGGPTGPGS